MANNYVRRSSMDPLFSFFKALMSKRFSLLATGILLFVLLSVHITSVQGTHPLYDADNDTVKLTGKALWADQWTTVWTDTDDQECIILETANSSFIGDGSHGENVVWKYGWYVVPGSHVIAFEGPTTEVYGRLDEQQYEGIIQCLFSIRGVSRLTLDEATLTTHARVTTDCGDSSSLTSPATPIPTPSLSRTSAPTNSAPYNVLSSPIPSIGVNIGDSAEYAVSISLPNVTMPTFLNFTVEYINDMDITLRVRNAFANGTVIEFFDWLDMMSGNGTARSLIIPAGLDATDIFYGEFSINWTSWDVYAGRYRETAVYVYNDTLGTQVQATYDRDTGILLEVDGAIFTTEGEHPISLLLQSTNLWGRNDVGVGGVFVPVDKFGLLAPYIALVVTIVAILVGTVYARKRWLGKAVVQKR